MGIYGAFQPGQWDHCLQEALLGSLPQPHQVTSGVSSLERVISVGAWVQGSLWLSVCPQDRSTWKHDPFQESGLHLSPTAAEAKEKAKATRVNKRAPQMDWNQKREIFSNF